MKVMWYNTHSSEEQYKINIEVSPSGKAPDFDSGIRRFESCHLNQTFNVLINATVPWATK